jgi:hypothetical protein
MTKRKVEAPQHARDCKTLAEKVAFSLMVREKWQELSENPWSCPSDIHEIIDRYDDPACPWSRADWADEWARRERTRRAIERMARDAK